MGDGARSPLREVRYSTLASLRAAYPVLEDVGFIKVDCEGCEVHLVPALASFVAATRASVAVEVHVAILGAPPRSPRRFQDCRTRASGATQLCASESVM